MPPLTLPSRDHATLRAFWLVLSSITGLLSAAAVAAARRDPRFVALSVPVTTTMALSGLRRPDLAVIPYRAWNRAGRLVGDVSTAWISRVAFGVVRGSRPLGGLAAVPARSPMSSGWEGRSSQPDSAFRHQDAEPPDWLGRDAFNRYARQPGHEWAESIRPLVRALAAIETDSHVDDTPPSDVYTLY